MNSKTLFQDLISAINLSESKDEVENIVYLLLENFRGLTKTHIISEKEVNISKDDTDKIANAIARINHHEPIQYILGKAFFYGRSFLVTPDVLIPRQETEELVHLILKEAATFTLPHILDIGTGSGCIPVTLALEIPNATVFATDISRKALSVAADNAKQLHAQVSLLHSDILSKEIPVSNVDILVSNPPYITPKEKTTMKENVLAHEPHLALFVPEDDPLLFYKAILLKGKKILNPNAMVFFEINEHLGDEVRALMISHGLTTEIVKDLSGKDRIAKGILKP